jgi:hypothetical protein
MGSIKEMNKKKHKAEEIMVDLMVKLTEELMYKIQSGEASSQDVRNAISLLKDNNVTVAVTKGEPLNILKEDKVLPFEGRHTDTAIGG